MGSGALCLPPPFGPNAGDEQEEQPEGGGGDEREGSKFLDRDGGHERRNKHPGRRYGEHDGEGCRTHLKGPLAPDAAGHPPPGEGVEPGHPGRGAGVLHEVEDAPRKECAPERREERE